MNRTVPYLFFLIIPIFFTFSLSAQKAEENMEKSTIKTDFSDRKAIIETIENFLYRRPYGKYHS